MKTHSSTSLPALIAGLVLAIATPTVAQTLVFSEDFGTLANGTAITTANTNLTFTRTAGATPYSGTLTAKNASSFGSGSSLILLSSGYGSSPNLTGVGVNDLASSDVWTLSVNIGTASWTSGTKLTIMMGDSPNASQQVYNPNGTITAPGVTDATIGAQSLFALNIVGSAGAGGAYLQTIGSTGTLTNIQNGGSNVALLNGQYYQLHLVANGGASALTVAGQTIEAGSMGIFLNGTYITSAAIADSVSATSLRIFAAGNSSGVAGSNQLAVELDNLNLWNGAAAPIPEASSFAMLGGAGALLTLFSRRKRIFSH